MMLISLWPGLSCSTTELLVLWSVQMAAKARAVVQTRISYMTIAEQIYEECRQLPEPLAREALNFVRRLRTLRARTEWRDLMHAQQSALTNIWDNEEDQVWNDV